MVLVSINTTFYSKCRNQAPNISILSLNRQQNIQHLFVD